MYDGHQIHGALGWRIGENEAHGAIYGFLYFIIIIMMRMCPFNVYITILRQINACNFDHPYYFEYEYPLNRNTCKWMNIITIDTPRIHP